MWAVSPVTSTDTECSLLTTLSVMPTGSLGRDDFPPNYRWDRVLFIPEKFAAAFRRCNTQNHHYRLCQLLQAGSHRDTIWPARAVSPQPTKPGAAARMAAALPRNCHSSCRARRPNNSRTAQAGML
jgi:hypothetical protein